MRGDELRHPVIQLLQTIHILSFSSPDRNNHADIYTESLDFALI
jgi:hypothetical protein